MWIGHLFRGMFGDSGRGVDELARRLGMSVEGLKAARVAYREFTIPKRAGGMRQICAPDGEGRKLQRVILRRLLSRLPVHEAAQGFERGRSIVTNARRHKDRAVVIHIDMKDFFDGTSAKRVDRYFKAIGWNGESRAILIGLVTRKGGLPQGAPTSPKLSNIVNYRLDTRLAALAKKLGAEYSRYADDITFSLAEDDRGIARRLIRIAEHIINSEGYQMHRRKKLHVWGRHNRQVVTGLVVNRGVNLPRETRRWLRAVEHRVRTGREASLSEAQLAGWRALARMVEKQR